MLIDVNSQSLDSFALLEGPLTVSSNCLWFGLNNRFCAFAVGEDTGKINRIFLKAKEGIQPLEVKAGVKGGIEWGGKDGVKTSGGANVEVNDKKGNRPLS